MKKTALVTGLLFALGASAPVMAADDRDEWTDGNNKKLFQALDSNGDGILTQDEVSGYAELENLFGHLDRNGNGEISNEEFGEYNPSQAVIDKVKDHQF